MKFNCGLTWAEKIAINNELRQQWHKWFALIPRRVENEECRWLEYIERKGESYMRVVGIQTGMRVKRWRYEYRVLRK